MSIPHVIHYCWFGGNPLPEQAKRCIESWKRFCPGFEIRQWDESNYDVNKCDYTREAYQAEKWAFVSDYARFDILNTHGGVYFDTDVELIRPIGDILEKGAFLGQEQRTEPDGGVAVAPGLGMASQAGNAVFEKMLRMYGERHFLCADGTPDQTTVVHYMTEQLRSCGLTDTEEIQTVCGITVYPWDYFCPLRYRTDELTITQNTRSIHHYSASWF